MTRILIADDHAIMRQGILQVLALAVDLEVMEEARNGWEVIEKLRAQPFDLLLLDMTMPGPSGADLVKRVRDEYPDLPVLILSMHSESQIAARALKAGAQGYLTKDNEPDILIAAVRKVAAGGRYIDPDLATKLVFETGMSGESQLHESLSDREYQILLRIAQGQSLNDVAEELHLSAKTVSTYKMRLKRKLGLTSTAELVRYVLQHRLTP